MTNSCLVTNNTPQAEYEQTFDQQVEISYQIESKQLSNNQGQTINYKGKTKYLDSKDKPLAKKKIQTFSQTVETSIARKLRQRISQKVRTNPYEESKEKSIFMKL